MALEIKNISKKYRNKTVLSDASFTAKNGSCIGILGRNGAGKSTLLSILAGIQKPDSGTFTYKDIDLFKDEASRGRIIGYVPQGIPLISELSAWDNLLLWYDRKALKKELDHGVLKILGINEFLKVPVCKMSGGMKKRLSIGCAVSQRPPVLLLDEPTAALDLACKKDIFQYLSVYKNAGGILILTTHDVAELEICDYCYILKNGKLNPYAFEGDINALIDQL